MDQKVHQDSGWVTGKCGGAVRYKWLLGVDEATINTQKVPMSKNQPNKISFAPPFTFELEGVIDLAITDATFVHISKETGR